MKITSNNNQTVLKFLTCLSVLFATLTLSSAWADDPKARQIMEKVDARDDGDNMTSDMQMVLIDKNENERIRLLRTFRKDKGRDQWKLMFFLEPADVRDTAFMSYDYYNADKGEENASQDHHEVPKREV